MGRDEIIEQAKEFCNQGKSAIAFDAFTLGMMADFHLAQESQLRTKAVERLKWIREACTIDRDADVELYMLAAELESGVEVVR